MMISRLSTLEAVVGVEKTKQIHDPWFRDYYDKRGFDEYVKDEYPDVHRACIAYMRLMGER
jgi:hypothetical protein